MVKIDDYKNDVPSQWCPGCPNFGILTALKMMNLNHFRHLVVVEKRRVVGIISATDLIRMSAY